MREPVKRIRIVLLVAVAFTLPVLCPAQTTGAQTGSVLTGAPVRVAAGVAAGQRLTSVPPIYPIDAKQAHITGTVVLHAVIGEDGQIRDLAVVEGPDLLRESALNAVRQWTYRPYLVNGTPVAVETTITVNYRMAGL